MPPLSVMIKPVSSACNMRCRYCFYADVSSLRDCPSYGIMSAQVREQVIRNIFAGLKPGDRLYVYTDGVPEATDANEELFGTERMLDALNRDPAADPQTLLRNVQQAIDAFVGDAPQFDDITMLGLHYKPSGRTEE